jgi:hypothetical protein
MGTIPGTSQDLPGNLPCKTRDVLGIVPIHLLGHEQGVHAQHTKLLSILMCWACCATRGLCTPTNAAFRFCTGQGRPSAGVVFLKGGLVLWPCGARDSARLAQRLVLQALGNFPRCRK